MGNFGQEERDMLIRIDENTRLMGKKLDCHVAKDDKNVKRWVLVPVVGFIMTLIAGAYGYTYKTDQHINKHCSDYNIHKVIETSKK